MSVECLEVTIMLQRQTTTVTIHVIMVIKVKSKQIIWTYFEENLISLADG